MGHIISRPAFFCLLTLVAVVTTACRPSLPEETTRSATPSPAATPVSPRVVFLGDSLTAGLGLAESEAFPAVTAALLLDAGMAIDVVNAGVSGDTSAGGLARLDWVLGQGVDILVVELGGNDALRGQSLDNTEANLRRIVDRARQAGARVLLLGMDIPINYGPDYATAFADIYGRVAEEEGATLVPGFVREVGTDPSLMQPDGLHPNADGHRLLAEVLAPYLETALRER